MLGRELCKVFHDQDFIALAKKDLDITDQAKVFEDFFNFQPDVVINAAGYTKVDEAESDEETAAGINGYAIGVLAKACREIDATFVHFSTDYVFPGTKRTGYNEEDPTKPINAYGKSKELGEKLLIEEMELLSTDFPVEGKYFLIRTSWLYGAHGKNFVDTMLQLGQKNNEVKVVNDQHGKPTYALDLAKQVKWLIDTHEYPSGIYHVTNDGMTSWFEFAKEIFKLAKMNTDVVPCGSLDYVRPAKRPTYSPLNNNKLPALRGWKEALKEYINSKQ